MVDQVEVLGQIPAAAEMLGALLTVQAAAWLAIAHGPG